jgi:hypothetical protein
VAKTVKVLLLIEVQASPGSEIDYEKVVKALQRNLEFTAMPGNPHYMWFVRSVKEAIAP